MARTTAKGDNKHQVYHGDERVIPPSFRSQIIGTKQNVPYDTVIPDRTFGIVKDWRLQTLTSESEREIWRIEKSAWPVLNDTEFDAETGKSIAVSKTIVASGTVTGGVNLGGTYPIVTEVQALDEVHDLILISSPQIPLTGLALVSGGAVEWSGPAESPTMTFEKGGGAIAFGVVGSRFEAQGSDTSLNAGTSYTERKGTFTARRTTLYTTRQTTLAAVLTAAGVTSALLALTLGNGEVLANYQTYSQIHANLDVNGNWVGGGGAQGSAVQAFRPPPWVGTLTINQDSTGTPSAGIEYFRLFPGTIAGGGDTWTVSGSPISAVPSGWYVLQVQDGPWKWGLWKYVVVEISL